MYHSIIKVATPYAETHGAGSDTKVQGSSPLVLHEDGSTAPIVLPSLHCF